MALRCLVFSSNEEMVQSIFQVLPDLGLEGEYCPSAVDAVEKVTTQLFQIVITDWDDQPEAAFLLKTARDLKAAHRPLTLAIVGDARMQEALKAGANSVLLKPIRAEQVRDTMTTACQLLRSKQQPPVKTAQASAPEQAAEAGALAAAASAAAVSAPTFVTQAPEKLRAGEFLQSTISAPGAQFDTESEVAPLQSDGSEVEALSQLEPTAAAVDSAPAVEPEPEAPLTGWAMLQARLNKVAPAVPESAPEKNELLAYSDSASNSAAPSGLAQNNRQDGGKVQASANSDSEQQAEAALFDYMSAESKANSAPTERVTPNRGPIFLAVALALFVALFAVPQTRRSLTGVYRDTLRAGGRWLNPPPATLPQAAAQHDSFGQAGDEYKFPVPGNIPDATTDPSAIRVLPVIDPTAKPDKNAAQTGAPQGPITENTADQNQEAPGQSVQVQAERKNPAAPGVEGTEVKPSQVNQPAATPVSDPSSIQVQAPPVLQTTVPQLSVTAPPRPYTEPQPQAISANAATGIPSSLKSQIASSVPESSGTKPAEAAMSSIEPVKLPESVIREFLTQTSEPEYPGKAAGQRGIVVLQVLIGRDGAVQDAKFLQGSLVFARAAIDAVKQWRFKPYTMNGRPVSVESVMTLNFKPPA
jgi:TonB family protein